MRRLIFTLVTAAATCGTLVSSARAQPPTYAPGNSLVAPGDPLVAPDSTIPSNSTPGSSTPSNLDPIPEQTYSIPSGNPVDPAASVVMPGTVPTYGNPNRGWYPGFWLGLPPGAVQYQTNYQGFGMPPAGGCNTCPSPCAPQNYQFGRGYDGFTTGW